MKKIILVCLIFLACGGMVFAQTTKATKDVKTYNGNIGVVVEEVKSEDESSRMFQIKTTETLQTEEVEKYEVKGFKKVNLEGNSKLLQAIFVKPGIRATVVEINMNNIFLTYHTDILKKYNMKDCNLVESFGKVFEVLEKSTERKIVNAGYFSFQGKDKKLTPFFACKN